MRCCAALFALILAAVLPACSVYPLPQDTTGSTTDEIVRNIRCEARAGIHETVLLWLRNDLYRSRPVWNGLRGGELADRLEREPWLWERIRIEDLDRAIRSDFAFYRNSQIAYEFTLTLEEQNSDNVSAGFTQNFLGRSNRVGALGLSATATRTRANQRSFNIVDTFEVLALKVDYRFCDYPRVIDIVYPVKGKLPIGDLITSYVRLNNFGNLGGPTDNLEKIFGTAASPAIPQMGDTVTFTTKLAASINPTLALTPPVGLGFLLSGAGFRSDDYRSDMHRVIVVVSTSPDAAKLKPLDARRAPQLAPEYGGPLSFGASAVAPPAATRNGVLTQRRANYARETIANQRSMNRDDDISTIAQALRQMVR